MIKITCPFCSFSREIPVENIPQAVVRVKCPMCNETFSFNAISTKKASFFSRTLAVIIDMLLLNAFFLIASFLLDFGLSHLFIQLGITDEDFSYKIIGSIIYFVCVLIAFFYFTYCTHKYGKTFGKRVLGIKVIDNFGRNPDLMSAFKREVVGKTLSSFFFGVGFLWALFDKDNQALHDKIAKTYVIFI